MSTTRAIIAETLCISETHNLTVVCVQAVIGSVSTGAGPLWALAEEEGHALRAVFGQEG